MPRIAVFALLCACLAARLCPAQQQAAKNEDPVHNELRALRDGFLDAFKKKDIQRMLGYLTDDVVITVQNGEVLRGHDQVLAFHKRMSEGADRRIESLETNFDVDDLSILYNGDTAVSFGSMNDHFKLAQGMEFDLHSRWTATLVKQDSNWKVAAFHVSTNMFDNGVSNLLIKWASFKSGGIALLAGILCGAIGGVWWTRRKSASAP
jgi:uncharacterized protein (TIGR02246 family)